MNTRDKSPKKAATSCYVRTFVYFYTLYMFCRLILISEKEQLLRELRSVSGRSELEMNSVRVRIEQLQRDIQDVVNIQNRQITERIKLSETKADVLRKLEKATQLTSNLETQLKRSTMSTYTSHCHNPIKLGVFA